MKEQNDITGSSTSEWQAPPPPENPKIEEEPAQMSEASTLGSIFFEPGKTFEDLRRKPRFLLALLIIIIVTTAFQFLFFQKMGEERFRRFAVEQIEKNPQTQALSAEQKQQSVDLNLTIINVVKYAFPLFIVFGFAIGGLIYWIAGKAMGGSLSFFHAVSTFVYSSFPPVLISMLANFIVLAFKSADEIDIATSQRGLVQASPGLFMDGKEMPVLATLLSTFDLFQIWGWILAAIGLQKMAKISSGAAWAIVLILALLGLTYRIISAYLSGNPM